MTEQRLVYLLTLAMVLAMAGLTALILVRLLMPVVHAFGGSA